MKGLIGAILLYSASAQTPAFRSTVELVTVPCSVLDSSGAPVTGLTIDDFRVFDNGVPRTIQHLWIDNDQPLTLAVLLDASESQQDQLAEHRKTAQALLDRVLRAGDQAFIVSVGRDVRLLPDLASTSGNLFGDPCALRVCGSSPLWNALYDAARLKLLSRAGNKAILILTDGFDSGSTRTWRQAADEAHKAEAAVYAIQYPGAFGGKYAPDLYRLTDEAGGATFHAPPVPIEHIVSRIETDLRHRYVLGFRPEKLTGKIRHDLRVELSRPNLTVRARKTYFQPQ